MIAGRQEKPFPVLLRYFIYLAAVIALIYWAWLAVRAQGIRSISESGSIEYMGLALLVLTFLIFSLGVLMAPRVRVPSILLATGVLLVIVRELNNALNHLLPAVGWKAPAFLVLAWGLFYAWRKRKKLRGGIACIMSTQAWPILCCAFLVAIPFAQLIGNGELFKTLMGMNYDPMYKQAIEEIGELFGAGLLVIGAVEMIWCCRGREKQIENRSPQRN